MKIDLPSPESIAKFARFTTPQPTMQTQSKKVSKDCDAAYYHSRYLVRRERNYANGLNAVGHVRSNRTREAHPELKGLIRNEYKRQWDKLNRKHKNRMYASQSL